MTQDWTKRVDEIMEARRQENLGEPYFTIAIHDRETGDYLMADEATGLPQALVVLKGMMYRFQKEQKDEYKMSLRAIRKMIGT
jgi:hypothetical protein